MGKVPDLSYNFKAGDIVSITLPSIETFESRIVGLDNQWATFGSPWYCEIPIELIPRLQEIQDNQGKNPLIWVLGLKAMEKHVVEKRFTLAHGILPFKEGMGYATLDEQYIEEGPFALAEFKIRMETGLKLR